MVRLVRFAEVRCRMSSGISSASVPTRQQRRVENRIGDSLIEKIAEGLTTLTLKSKSRHKCSHNLYGSNGKDISRLPVLYPARRVATKNHHETLEKLVSGS